jgi:hypothetical protein
MPEDVETHAARVAAAAGRDGRLPVDPEGVVERLVADIGGSGRHG